MSNRYVRGFIVVALVLAAPRPSSAQASAAALAIGGIDKIFEKVEALNIYSGRRLGKQAVDTLGGDGTVPWTKDYGLEFLVHVGGAGPKQTVSEWAKEKLFADATTKAKADAAKKAAAAKAAEAEGKPAYDTTSITARSRIVLNSPTTVVTSDTSVLLTPAAKDGGEPMLEFDLGVGYGQLEGIVTKVPFEIHANVRELPSVSTYLSVRLIPRLTVWVAGRTGLILLQDAQFYLRQGDTTYKHLADPTQRDSSYATFSAGASSFEMGSAAGVDVKLGKVIVTAEWAYNRRRFHSLNYSPATPLPLVLPHQMNLSSGSFEVGVQLPLKK